MSSNKHKKPALGRGLSALLHNTNTDVTSFKESPAGSITEIALSFIDTNPFNPRTQISFNIPISDFIEITIYDINGNLVNILYDGYIQSGEHTLSWSAEGLSSGVYIVKSMYQNSIITKKAILIK